MTKSASASGSLTPTVAVKVPRPKSRTSEDSYHWRFKDLDTKPDLMRLAAAQGYPDLKAFLDQWADKLLAGEQAARADEVMAPLVQQAVQEALDQFFTRIDGRMSRLQMRGIKETVRLRYVFYEVLFLTLIGAELTPDGLAKARESPAYGQFGVWLGTLHEEGWQHSGSEVKRTNIDGEQR